MTLLTYAVYLYIHPLNAPIFAYQGFLLSCKQVYKEASYEIIKNTRLDFQRHNLHAPQALSDLSTARLQAPSTQVPGTQLPSSAEHLRFRIARSMLRPVIYLHLRALIVDFDRFKWRIIGRYLDKSGKKAKRITVAGARDSKITKRDEEMLQGALRNVVKKKWGWDMMFLCGTVWGN